MTSSWGKTISAEADKKPSLFTFFRSASLRADAVQPKVCFFAPFFDIFDRCTTRLMGMQWCSTRRRESELKEEEAAAAVERITGKQ
jgi:hypothetical protein